MGIVEEWVSCLAHLARLAQHVLALAVLRMDFRPHRLTRSQQRVNRPRMGRMLLPQLELEEKKSWWCLLPRGD